MKSAGGRRSRRVGLGGFGLRVGHGGGGATALSSVVSRLLLSVLLLSLSPSSPSSIFDPAPTSSSPLFVVASDFHSPHPHRGVVAPFRPGDPKVELDSAALKILASGKPYQTQTVDSSSEGSSSSSSAGGGGRGLVVQDVNAPSDVVWDRILDYDRYADMVPKTAESANYDVVKHRPTRKDPLERTIFTRMKVGFPLLKLEFYVKHLHYPSLNSLTWTLDYDRTSDLNDSVGYWYVVPHPDDPQCRTRVYYSVQVSLFDWMPKVVVDFLMGKRALTDATGWVKKYSELEWEKDPRRREAEKKRAAAKRGTTAGAGESAAAESNKRGAAGLFGRKRRRGSDGDSLATAAMLSPSQSSPKTASSRQQEASDEGRRKQRKANGLASVGWLRIVLLTLVSALAVYNVALFLDGASAASASASSSSSSSAQ